MVARVPSKNLITTDGPRKACVYFSVDMAGSVMAQSGDINVQNLTGGVFKVTLFPKVPISQEMIDNASMSNSQLGNGIESIFSVNAMSLTDLDSVGAPIFTIVSRPTKNADGAMFFYLQMSAASGVVAAAVRIVANTMRAM